MIKRFLTSILSLTKPIEIVNDINLEYYTGTWYQVATSRSTNLMGTGPSFKDVKAEYNCIGNCSHNNISVFNDGYDKVGNYKSIEGYSYCNNKNNTP